MVVPGYRIVEELGSAEAATLSHGTREEDGTPVLLRIPAAASSGPALAALDRERTLLAGLSLPGVPRPLGLDAATGSLVLEYEGGELLASRLDRGPLTTSELLAVARPLVATIAGLHRLGIVHRNLSPASILADPARGLAWIVDFSLASRLPEEAKAPLPARQLHPRLAYMSPEQTGRMNRTVDHRTDLYSLGVTLYHALTGVLPFDSTDPLELVHWHMARAPEPPHTARPGVPRALSDIVLKLLAKTPDERYQTAAGLFDDLETCAAELARTGAIVPFQLARRDVSDRLLIPQRLYGRETEVAKLLEAFGGVCQGQSALVLVRGYSGVGKTSLVSEVHKPIVRERGFFLSGKFDQLARSVPYGALAQAFRGLLPHVLADADERVSAHRERLSSALGANASVVLALVPDLEALIGAQPPPPELGRSEARNRLHQAFQAFIGAFARAEHPLVLFLDDLQWADTATLALLAHLLTSPELEYFCVIGAYRDNEVPSDHPLLRTVGEIEAAGTRVRTIALSPLALPHVAQLVRDALHGREGESEDLARLLLRKTDGNPFFVIQFLKSLVNDGLLQFDHAERRWSFDLARIERAGITDNVVDLMTRRLERLPAPVRGTVALAACIGGSFALGTLAVVRQRHPRDVAEELEAVVAEGLVLPGPEEARAGSSAGDPSAGEPVYRFLHDRVQQAAYALIPESEKAPVHLRVGRLLLAGFGGAVPEERVFEVANHLNLGRMLIVDEPERAALTRLNLAAGRRAKASAAFDAALGYFEAGAGLIGDADWQTDYEVALEVHLQAAECRSLCGEFDEAERAFARLLELARTRLDKARVYNLKVLQCESLSRYTEALRVGREALALFAIAVPDDPEARRAALDAELATIERLIGGRPIPGLAELPAMEDPEIRVVMKLLTNLHTSCFLSGDKDRTLLNTAAMVRLSLLHGNAEESAYGYILHAAMLVGPIQEDRRAAFELGQLALALNDRFPNPALRSRVLMNLGWAVTLWCRPFEDSFAPTREAFRLGHDNGLFVEASYALFNECWLSLLSARELGETIRIADANVEYVRRVKMHRFAVAPLTIRQWASALAGLTESPASLSDAGFDEQAFGRDYEHDPLFRMFFLVAKLALLYTFGEAKAACGVAVEAERVIRDFTGTIWDALRVFYHALALAAVHDDASQAERAAIAATLSQLEPRLAHWAETCPENFETWRLLVSAEIARTRGAHTEAVEQYEAALAAASGASCPREQALASELLARFWERRGQGRVAKSYLSEARKAYRRWGADAKVREMEAASPELREAAGREAGSLDAASVMKAAHAVAREIETDRLVRTLVRIAIENAGAERGLLLQERDGRLHLVAEGAVGGEDRLLRPPAPVEERRDLSRAIAQLVHTTGRSVLVGDAASDPRWLADPYVRERRPRSILCVPLVHQGQRRGILYLENQLAAEAFTPQRVEMMEALSAQAAIALENARLYQEIRSLKDRLQAENVYLQEEIRTQHNFEEITGGSPVLLEALARVEKVAATDSTVLILGETGVGKELFARAVHSRSARRERPLVKVNCGAIAAGLVESELFGHVKGAFTGALQKRVGRFELADGGTLFLDEVGELPPETQVKLLRVLQEREFEPVGSSRTVRVDVRLIAATNRDLEEAVRAGRFRSDLLYRLNVFPIRVPSLAERRSDIPALVGFLLSGLAKRLGKPLEGFSRRSMDRLMAYHWPGNVRELQNVVEQAAILARGPILELATESITPARAPGGREAPATIEEVEREHVRRVLQATGGVVEGPRGAAQILGLHPNTLRSRMKKLGLSPRSPLAPLTGLGLPPDPP